VNEHLPLESHEVFTGLVTPTEAIALEPLDVGPLLDYSFRNPDLWLYRERTLALLRRYLRISIEVGRLPSLLGRELFRSKVTSYRMTNFEDAVIFVYDVERALDQVHTLETIDCGDCVPGLYAGRGCRSFALCAPHRLQRVSGGS
jgi:hypothetical protein